MRKTRHRSGNIILIMSLLLSGISGGAMVLRQFAMTAEHKQLRAFAHMERSFYAGEVAAVNQYLIAQANPAMTDGNGSVAMQFTPFTGAAPTAPAPYTQNVDRSVTALRDDAPNFFMQGYAGNNLIGSRSGMQDGSKSFCGSLQSSTAMPVRVCLSEIVVPGGGGSVTACTHWIEDPEAYGEAPIPPIVITSEAQLRAQLVGGSNKYLKLEADIELTSPIPSFFLNGSVFDGGGHTISNVRLMGAGGQDRGFFASIDSSKVTNLKLKNVKIDTGGSPSGALGGLAGRATSSCINAVSVIGGEVGGHEFDPQQYASNVGGLVGFVSTTAPRSEITNSFTSVRVRGRMHASGLVGGAPYTNTGLQVGGSSSTSYVKGGKMAAGFVAGDLGGSTYATIFNSSFGGTLASIGKRTALPPPYYDDGHGPTTILLSFAGEGVVREVEAREHAILDHGVYYGIRAMTISDAVQASTVIAPFDELGPKFVRDFGTYVCRPPNNPPPSSLTRTVAAMTVAASLPMTYLPNNGWEQGTHICGEITDAYWDSDLDKTGGTSMPRAGAAKTSAELKGTSLYTSWDPNTWKKESGKYPKLKTVPPLPATRASCTLVASQATVNAGDSVELSIPSVGTANYVLINETQVSASDARLTVTPQYTRTYEGWVMGKDGVAPCRVDVHVNDRPRVVMAGMGSNTTAATVQVGAQYVLTRYHHDGTLDTYFGPEGVVSSVAGDGKNFIFANHGPMTDAAAIVLPDGKVTMFSAGATLTGTPPSVSAVNHAIVMSRFLSSGALDTTFGTGGKKAFVLAKPRVYPGGQASWLRKVVRQPDGKYLAMGHTLTIVNSTYRTDTFLVRINEDGSADTTHALTGTSPATTSLYEGIMDNSDLAVQPDGSALALLQVESTDSTLPFCSGTPQSVVAVVKIRANGTVDTGFGVSGIRRFCLPANGTPNANSRGRALVLLSSGKILVAGSAQPDALVSFVRLDASGAIDTTYNGTGGRVINTLGAIYVNSSRMVTWTGTDGRRFVLSSHVKPGTVFETKPCVMELNADGVWNQSAGTNGLLCFSSDISTQYPGTTVYPDPVAFTGDRFLVFPGSTYSHNGKMPFVMSASGVHDTTWGTSPLDPMFKFVSFFNPIPYHFDGIIPPGSSNGGYNLITAVLGGGLQY